MQKTEQKKNKIKEEERERGRQRIKDIGLLYNTHYKKQRNNV